MFQAHNEKGVSTDSRELDVIICNSLSKDVYRKSKELQIDKSKAVRKSG